jgi:hypothetical protein
MATGWSWISASARTNGVVLEAGTHEQSLRLRTSDLVELTEAWLVDPSQD